MGGSNRFRDLISYIPGLLTVFLGIYLVIEQPHIAYVINTIRSSVELVEGTIGYDAWKDESVFFRVFLFHVTNPNEVMQGEAPVFEERGPYVYDLQLKKNIIKIDEDLDEMTFTVFRTYYANLQLSGSRSLDDDIVILNSAYYGSILTMFEKFPMFIGKFGNSMQYLFPDTYDIFLRGKVRDILFDGLPLVCDKNAHSELTLICNALQAKKPPIIKDTGIPNQYIYSFFERLNMSNTGPFTVNRGVKNKNALGNITSYKRMRTTKYWSETFCNVVSGTDTITWAPMDDELEFVAAYEPNVCRTMNLYFKKREIIHGLTGYRFQLDETLWTAENMKCYCPINAKKELQCLPTGLLDITKCQEVPLVYSEPHFLHGDPNLYDFAQGLNPNEDEHQTFIVIEPMSGIPLKGVKKFQLNLKLQRIPTVELLSNVSEGYFPILWAEEGNTATSHQLLSLIMAHRILHLFKFFSWMLIVLGTFSIVKIRWIRNGNNQKIFEATAIQTLSITVRSDRRLIYRRPVNGGQRALI